VIGGGTGLSTMLRGLKKYSNNISAIVTMVDNGASTGRLRRDFKVLPPGDIRQCLAALSSDEVLMAKMFQYRFDRGKGIAGHSLGNLLIVALEQITGSFKEAIHTASNLLAIEGQVLPATYDKIQMYAALKNGHKIIGEDKISHSGHISPIDQIYLKPKKVKANPEAVKAIKEAELIVIGPGSLYTSILTNFLIEDIKNAVLKNKKALKLYIANCSTEVGETEGYTVADHLNAFSHNIKTELFDWCIVNKKVIRHSIHNDKLGEVNNITTRKKKIGDVNILSEEVVSNKNPLYHDPDKLAKAIVELYNKIKKK